MALLSSTLFSSNQKILLFAGSTRKDSVNKKLILEAARIAKQRHAKVTVIDLKDYPILFYDGDLETTEGMPQNAQKLRQLMIDHQIIIISTPEYNASLSAVLKNSLDWASRKPGGGSSRDAFQGKTFVLLSASPSSSGGFRARQHLRSVIENVGGNVFQEGFSLPKAYEAFDQNGKLKNIEAEAELQKLIQNVLETSVSVRND